MKRYEFSPIDLEQVGRDGSGSIRVKVHGFWSRDTMTAYIRREFTGENKGVWTTSISHSSGGRDTKEEPCDLQAARNFGEAMIDLANYVEGFMSTAVPELEKHFQTRRAEDRAIFEAEKAAKQAKIDADQMLGASRAREMIDSLAANPGQIINAIRRGDDWFVPVTCSIRAKTKFYFAGNSISRKELLIKLSEQSSRSTFA